MSGTRMQCYASPYSPVWRQFNDRVVTSLPPIGVLYGVGYMAVTNTQSFTILQKAGAKKVVLVIDEFESLLSPEVH